MINECYPILNRKYYLLQKLGQGATSCVFLGCPTDNDKNLLAIKIITNPKIKLEAFEQETKILSQLHHPNIIGLVDHGVGSIEKNQQISDKKQYLVLEYAQRGILFDYIRDTGKPFGEEMGRYLFHGILKGVETIHKNGFAHRDLKIENMLIDGEYNIKIGDFGFASSLEGKSGNGKLTSQVGTLKYCAPEILRKRPYIGTQVDVFSLGICFFIIVYGKYPFGAATKFDPGYKLIMQKQFDTYWTNSMGQYTPSEEFKDFFNQMVFYDSSFRPSVSKLLDHPFMKKEMPTKEQFVMELQSREQFIFEKQKMVIMREMESQSTGIGSSQVFRAMEEEGAFTSQFIIPKYKKEIAQYKNYVVRVKGVEPFSFMNRLMKEIEDSKLFEKEIICDSKKLQFIVKTPGFDKVDEEDDAEDENEIEIHIEELKVKLTLKEEEEKGYLLDIKKQHGCYEDYFRLSEETRKIVARILN